MMKQQVFRSVMMGIVAGCVLISGMCLHAEAQENVTLRFWHTMNEKETPTLNSIIEEFEHAYPNVTVQVEYVPFGDAQNKFEIAAQTGAAPDVMRAEVMWTAGFADFGYLLALDEYLSSEEKADFLPAAFAYNVYQDETWGIPQVTDALALLYNKRLLQEAGHDTPPATLAEMEQVVADVKAAHGIEGFYMRGNAHWFLPFLWAFGGNMVDAQRNIYINSDASVRALEYFVKQAGTLFPADIDFAKDYNDAMTLFKSGKVAMILNGPWATADILSGEAFEDDGNLGVAPFPKGPDGEQGSPVGGHNYVISADTAYPDEAYRFIYFLSQPQYQVRFAVQNNLLPTRMSAYDDPQVKSNAIVQGFLAQMQVARARPVIPEGGLLYTHLSPNFRAAWRGEKTPEQALNDVAESWKLLLGVE